ncbi:GNAT family N-acetyltransferase [Corynebacterium sp. LK2510]|uniref:GNAT family N-acetyltransferase n=1 Tax=Corynebacterium sp. LK2510 TaxID=3110472 RepID=UPI0034CFACA5
MLTLREATPADKAAAIEIWDASGITAPWNDPPHDFDRALAAPGSVAFVVESEQRVEAIALTGFDGHLGWIHMVGVRPEAQGQGIGRMLADAAKAYLKDNGATGAYLMTDPANQRGRKFWEREGFFEIDAVVFTAPLGDN